MNFTAPWPKENLPSVRRHLTFPAWIILLQLRAQEDSCQLSAVLNKQTIPKPTDHRGHTHGGKFTIFKIKWDQFFVTTSLSLDDFICKMGIIMPHRVMRLRMKNLYHRVLCIAGAQKMVGNVFWCSCIVTLYSLDAPLSQDSVSYISSVS